MDFVAAEAEVGGGGNVVLLNVGMLVAPVLSAVSCGLSALLRRVVFLGQPHFGAGADRQGVRLSAVNVGASQAARAGE